MKTAKYACFAEDYQVVPIAIETHGATGPTTTDCLKQLSSRIGKVRRDLREGAYFQQRLSLALQRGNALCVLEALGSDLGGDFSQEW